MCYNILMKQAIVKFKIANRDQFEATLDRQNHDLSPIYWLHDRTYVPRGYRPRNNFPRLTMRTAMHAIDEPPTYTLLLRRHIEDSGLDIVEETPVTDYVATVNIITQLGFIQAGEVSRRRQTAHLEDNVILHLDELDGPTRASSAATSVGDPAPAAPAIYAKLETTLQGTASPLTAKTALIHLAKTLGEDNIIEKPYTEL